VANTERVNGVAGSVCQEPFQALPLRLLLRRPFRLSFFLRFSPPSGADRSGWDGASSASMSSLSSWVRGLIDPRSWVWMQWRARLRRLRPWSAADFCLGNLIWGFVVPRGGGLPRGGCATACRPRRGDHPGHRPGPGWRSAARRRQLAAWGKTVWLGSLWHRVPRGPWLSDHRPVRGTACSPPAPEDPLRNTLPSARQRQWVRRNGMSLAWTPYQVSMARLQ